MASENEARAREICADELCYWRKATGGKDSCESCEDITAALDAAEARERDRWTREVQHRFDTCEARHVDEWRAFAVKMGVVLTE